jgi:hypothetical protein
MKIKIINLRIKKKLPLTDVEILFKFYKVKSKEIVKQLRYINSNLQDLTPLNTLRVKQVLSNMIIKDLESKGLQLQLF